MGERTNILQKNIHQSITANRKDGIHLLKRLVQIASTQGKEADAQRIILETLFDMGLDVDLWEPNGEELQASPYFASSRYDFSGSPNVVGVLKGTGGGRSIILNGHIDVVPAGDRNQWEEDPFSGIVKNGKMYGRGVTDMKGGNVSMLVALKTLQTLNIRLKGDVIFESVIEEESGGSGTLAAILRGYQADAALIPEPTNMKIFPKQQGSMWFRIHVKGRSAHGGTRYEGVSAIDKSLIVIKHIKELEDQRNKRITDPLYAKIPIPIPINIGKIEGGEWPSSVPDFVILEGRMGVSPDEQMEDARLEIETWIEGLGEVEPWFNVHPASIEWYGGRWLPGSIDSDHELLSLLSENYRFVLNEEAIIEASPWGTDGGLLTQVGNIPSIVFGPGVTDQAHFPNEYIELDRVFEAAEIIVLTLIDWCGVEY
ncbi:acetylornithine deacetylase [Salipaludibacillus neizhouensis]|uniref:Acetylornithine deacetylase n=1 Tax=Salipaludibacillus neizhouensis TaxID=885475 RepID=A0A3A9JXR4_9BACI|nr:peptidase [Salipaludibacillus neizhouensis]RKL65684.1 acetylornithine deacetylase [Salipaludibacillus neizhouensis]